MIRPSRLRDYDARPLQKHPSPLLVHGALASVAVLFSLNYVISKFGLHSFNPLTFAYLRIVSSAIILNFVLHERNP